MTFETWLHKIEMSAPDDVSGLDELLGSGEIDAAEVRAVLVKTEGDGGAADYSETLARRAFEEALGRGRAGTSDAAEAVVLAAGGCEGTLSPHAVIVGRRGHSRVDAGSGGGAARLSVGTSRTRPLRPAEVGRSAQVDLVAEATAAAMADAHVDAPRDVGCVLVRSPHLTPRVIAGESSGSLATEDAFASMTLSNGAAALGVGVALGEVERGALREGDIGRRSELNCSAALTSSSPDESRCQVVDLGSSRESVSPFAVGRASLDNLVDVRGVLRGVSRAVGSEPDDALDPGRRGRTVAVFGSAVAPLDGQLHGRRVTFKSDSVLRYRMTRAATAAVMTSVTGDAAVFVTGGELYHQGSGMVAAIARVS